MIKDATIVVNNTINQLSALYQAATVIHTDENYTQECLNAIMDYNNSLE
jgi:hypothetical protein